MSVVNSYTPPGDCVEPQPGRKQTLRCSQTRTPVTLACRSPRHAAGRSSNVGYVAARARSPPLHGSQRPAGSRAHQLAAMVMLLPKKNCASLMVMVNASCSSFNSTSAHCEKESITYPSSTYMTMSIRVLSAMVLKK